MRRTDPTARRGARRAVAVALALHGLLLAVPLLAARGDPTALLCVGEGTRLPPGTDAPVRFAGSGGYDGQFYGLVALDPANRRGTAAYLDDPGKRYGRIFLPGIARLAGADTLREAARVFAAVNLVAVAAIAALAAAAGGPDRSSEASRLLAGAAAATQVGLAVAVFRSLPGPAGTALVLAALRLDGAGRTLAAGLVLAAAPLDHEVFVAVPVAFAVRDLARRRPSGLLWLASLVPAAAWRAALGGLGVDGGIPFTDVGLPLSGAIGSLAGAAGGGGFLPERAYELVHAAAFFALPFLAARLGGAAAPCLALWTAAALADRDVWTAFWSASRASAPAFALAAAFGRPAARGIAAAAASFTPAMVVWFSLFPPDLLLP